MLHVVGGCKRSLKGQLVSMTRLKAEADVCADLLGKDERIDGDQPRFGICFCALTYVLDTGATFFFY